MRRSWLYFATRSLRAGAPVLIWPQPVATARSAIVASSVSPLRCDITAVYPLVIASVTVSSVSVSVPIWFTFTRIELATPVLDAAREPLGVGDEHVVAHELHAVAELLR